MLPLDGSGGRSERNLPFQVARASDRSLVCTRQTLALRPQTPSSGHLVPTTGFHSIPSADKVFFPLLNVSESCANGDIRLRHFPFFSTLNNARPSTRKSNLRPKSRNFLLSKTRKLSVSAVRVIETLRLPLMFWLQRNSITLLLFFSRQLSVCGSIFYWASCS